MNKLCESGKLVEALILLQADSNNVALGSSQRAEATGLLLQACGQHKNVDVGRKVHELVRVSTQLASNVVLKTRIITMYSMCGSSLDFRLVFDQLQMKILFQWNAIVSGYTRNELWDDAISMSCELISSTEHKPDDFTLPCVIKACAELLDWGLGQTVHGIAVKMNLISDVFVGNALFAMYGKCGFVDEAVKVFAHMPESNLVSWNSLITGFLQNGDMSNAIDLFKRKAWFHGTS